MNARFKKHSLDQSKPNGTLKYIVHALKVPRSGVLFGQTFAHARSLGYSGWMWSELRVAWNKLRPTITSVAGTFVCEC